MNEQREFEENELQRDGYGRYLKTNCDEMDLDGRYWKTNCNEMDLDGRYWKTNYNEMALDPHYKAWSLERFNR